MRRPRCQEKMVGTRKPCEHRAKYRITSPYYFGRLVCGIHARAWLPSGRQPLSEKHDMKRVECVAYLGKLPQLGDLEFWDTGRKVTQEQLAEAVGLHKFILRQAGKTRKDAVSRLMKLIMDFSHQANVWLPQGAKGGLSYDGRIFVAAPYFEEKEEADGRKIP